MLSTMASTSETPTRGYTATKDQLVKRLKRIEGQQWCASLVGGHGTGKTTLLEQLAPRLQERGFEPHVFRLSADVSMREKERLPEKLREVVAPGFILLDGAEQLSTKHWLSVRAAASKAAGFVVTVHRSFIRVQPAANPRLTGELVPHLSNVAS